MLAAYAICNDGMRLLGPISMCTTQLKVKLWQFKIQLHIVL